MYTAYGRSYGGVWTDWDRYFEGGISSVYLWDMDDGFAGCVLLKKSMCMHCPTACLLT